MTVLAKSSIDICILHNDEKIDVNRVTSISEVDAGIIVIETTNQSLYTRAFNDDLVVIRINNHKVFAKIEGVKFHGIEDAIPYFEIICNKNKIDEETEYLLNIIY